MRILGVDPGVSGALAVWDRDTRSLRVYDMPHMVVKGSRKRISEPLLVEILRGELPLDHAIIEQVHALPRQGVSSMFTFGMAYGAVRGVVAALGISIDNVSPMHWKRHYRLGKDKDAAREKIVELLPKYASCFTLKKHHNRAEAALLAMLEDGS